MLVDEPVASWYQKKENLHADEWAKTIAPTTEECRKAFNHVESALITEMLPIQLNDSLILTQILAVEQLKKRSIYRNCFSPDKGATYNNAVVLKKAA